MPQLIGKRLDVAEAILRAYHLGWQEIGGGVFGIVVRSNWEVCETMPRAGRSVAAYSRVQLVVDRHGYR